jgi:hypothetical protein
MSIHNTFLYLYVYFVLYCHLNLRGSVEVGTNIQMSGWQSCKNYITSVDMALFLSCTPVVKSYSNKGGYPWKSTFFLLY